MTLQRQIDGRARRQHELALALGEALHFFIGPVEEPVGAVRRAVLDDARRVHPCRMHLAGRVVAGVDEVIENLVGAGARRRRD